MQELCSSGQFLYVFPRQLSQIRNGGQCVHPSLWRICPKFRSHICDLSHRHGQYHTLSSEYKIVMCVGNKGILCALPLVYELVRHSTINIHRIKKEVVMKTVIAAVVMSMTLGLVPLMAQEKKEMPMKGEG